MKKIFNTFTQDSRTVHLSPDARERMRSKLVAHMQANPVMPTPIVSSYQRIIGVLSPLRMPIVVSALAVFIIVGSATTFAARGALPGSPLYSIKVGVIEPARGLLATSPEAKVAWNVSLVETRMNEVVQLAEKAQLTPEEGAKSRERFDASLHTAQTALDTLSQDNPEAATKIETSFASSLGEHQESLNNIGVVASSTSTNTIEAHSFANHIKDKVDATLSKHNNPKRSPDSEEKNGAGKK